MKIAAVLLAAGQGTRMKSELPKILHPVCGLPMVFHALSAASAVSTETPVVVIGHGAQSVQTAIGEKAACIVQEQQLGTGHAVMQAEPVLKGKADVILVTYGDMPLLRAETLQRLVQTQLINKGPMSLLTIVHDNPRGFGRIQRNQDGSVRSIIEEHQATPEQLAVKELNVGAYCFQAEWLWDALRKIKLSPKGEYYLTDTVELASKEGACVQAIVMDDFNETVGVNTRVHLAEAEAVMRSRINQALMISGVTIIDPGATYIDATVSIGSDTVIYPNTYISGKTNIGSNCQIGPSSHIKNTMIGNHSKVFMSVCEGAELGNHVDIGPFARLRKGAHLSDWVHMGNFGEVKDSTLGPGVKMGHFSYIGNAVIGADTNIGAGTITCNYDGEKKNNTVIGEDVFIGSDTMLVAPLTIGDGARTGAGAVVTKNVAEDTLVVGMPARAIKKLVRKPKKHGAHE